MAKVYSHSESRAKGSVGMTTYRTVRGKVIQSQKISPWDAAVESVGAATRWNDRTALLGIISLFCALHGQSIKNSFNRTKNGSQRNYFMKKNYAAMKAAFANLATAYAATKVVPTMQAIEDALGSYAALHANTVYRIKKSGYDIQFLSNNWNDADDPVAPAIVSSISYNLDEDYNLIDVDLVGSGLSNSLSLFLDGVLLDGSINIQPGAMAAKFTVNGTVLVKGSKTLVVKVGASTLNSAIVEGDPRPYYNLGLTVNPVGGGTVSGAGTFVEGASAPISAVAAAGYAFKQWSDGNMNASRNVVMNSNLTLTAEFEDTRVPMQYASSGNSSVLIDGSLEPAKLTRVAAHNIEFSQIGEEAFSGYTLKDDQEVDRSSYLGSTSSPNTTITIPADFDGEYLTLGISVS
jgi:hypothetical protein